LNEINSKIFYDIVTLFGVDMVVRLEVHY